MQARALLIKEYTQQYELLAAKQDAKTAEEQALERGYVGLLAQQEKNSIWATKRQACRLALYSELSQSFAVSDSRKALVQFFRKGFALPAADVHLLKERARLITTLENTKKNIERCFKTMVDFNVEFVEMQSAKALLYYLQQIASLDLLMGWESYFDDHVNEYHASIIDLEVLTQMYDCMEHARLASEPTIKDALVDAIALDQHTLQMGFFHTMAKEYAAFELEIFLAKLKVLNNDESVVEDARHLRQLSAKSTCHALAILRSHEGHLAHIQSKPSLRDKIPSVEAHLQEWGEQYEKCQVRHANLMALVESHVLAETKKLKVVGTFKDASVVGAAVPHVVASLKA